MYKRTKEILRISGVTENDLIEEFLKKGFKLPLKLMVKGIVFNSKLSAIHEGSSLARGVDHSFRAFRDVFYVISTK